MLLNDLPIEQGILMARRRLATDYGPLMTDFFVNCGCRGNKRLLLWGFQDETRWGGSGAGLPPELSIYRQRINHSGKTEGSNPVGHHGLFFRPKIFFVSILVY
jgi:hypothetical protein